LHNVDQGERGISDSPNPFLRWAGSKRWCLPFLRSSCASTFKRYVEPFAGSACLFFDLQPASALLGDLNGELIQTFRAVRDDPIGVHKAMSQFGLGRTAYYRVRDLAPKSLERVKRAARFIYLNRFCFNGLYRTNTQGKFNVPYGKPKNNNLPTLQQLEACSRQLRLAKLLHADFRKTLAEADKGDFIYLDPPYAVSNRRVFVEYGAKTFTIEDLVVLRDILRSLDKRGLKFLMTYADCSEARRLFKQWNRRRMVTRRNVAGFAGARRQAYELCITNLNS
jgi:DNA adenine methylase